MNLTFPGVALIPTLQAITVIGVALTAAKLFKTGLHRSYRFFFVFLLFYIPATLFSLFLQQESKAYFFFFVTVLPLTWFFHARIVFELYSLTLQRHRAFYSVGKWTLFVGLAIAIVVSGLSFWASVGPATPEISVLLGIFAAAQRAIEFSLALFLLLLMLVLAFYTVPLSRNLAVHAVLFSVFFISSSMSTILRSVFGLAYAQAVDAGYIAVACLCSFAWFFLLSPQGEAARVAAPWFGHEQEERILQKLDALNATMLKAAGSNR